MRSIRRDLQISLLLTLLVVMGLAALAAWHAGVHEIDEVFDARLAQYTRLLSMHASEEGHAWVPVPHKHEAWVGHKYESRIAFQVWDAQHTLLSASGNVAETKPLGPFDEGFHPGEEAGRPLRVFVLRAEERWYMAAEELDIRNELVGEIVWTVVMPGVLASLAIMALGQVLLARGFAPLQRLAALIRQRQPADLAPLELAGVPEEIRPLADNLNGLLQRMRDSLGREQRFTADVAHELKTPLAALKLRLANLQASAAPGLAGEIQRLSASVDSIQRIVEQLLLLHRLQPQAFAGRLQPVPVLPVCRAVLAEEAPFALDKQQDIQLDAEESGHPCVLSDPALLQVLLRNLVHNAVQYTPPGGQVLLQVRVSGGEVTLRVIDSGPGIPEAERARVFDRFYRVGGDTHDSGVDGSGLGLAIVREIVQVHNGRVALAAGEGGTGLCVEVVLSAA